MELCKCKYEVSVVVAHSPILSPHLLNGQVTQLRAIVSDISNIEDLHLLLHINVDARLQSRDSARADLRPCRSNIILKRQERRQRLRIREDRVTDELRKISLHLLATRLREFKALGGGALLYGPEFMLVRARRQNTTGTCVVEPILQSDHIPEPATRRSEFMEWKRVVRGGAMC